MDKINKIGLTLQELQKKAKKQSDNPKALGWFQRFNTGSAPINNAFFNQGTGPVESPSGNGEVAAPDGGIGAVGPVGESMENKDKTTFYYNKNLQLKEGEDQNLNEDDLVVEVVVDKEDIINAIKYLLRYDSNFVDYSDEDFDKTVCDHWESIRDDYYDELHDFFRNKEAHEGEGCDCENFTDEFYDDEVEVPEEEEEVDPDFTSTMFEGIDSDDPEVSVTEYDYRSPYDFDEDWDEEEQDDDDEQGMSRYKRLERKSVYDSDGFTTDYVLYYDYYEGRYFTMFGDEDLYAPDIDYADADFDTYEQAKEWFDNYEGFTDEDEEEDFTFDECVHPTVKANAYKKPSNPYSKVKDVSFYDDDVDGKVHVTESGFKPKNSKFNYDDNPINEGAMSELDIERQENAELLDKLEKNITALEDELDFLKNQAPKEIRRGGAFDSQEEIDDAIKETDRELAREKAKLAIIRRGQR